MSVKFKYQQSVKEKVAAQRARLVNTKEKLKQNIRQNLLKTAIDIGYDTHYVIRAHNGNNFSFASIFLSFPSDIQSQENTI